ncbi:MAG: sugar phosphate isomerase/epimerase [Chthoniobacteraceae bacterium]
MPSISRRTFLHTTMLATGTAIAAEPKPKLKLGIDNFAVRAMGWKAPRLVEYAAELKCDTVLISDLLAFESLDDAYLRDVRAKADALKVEVLLGSWSICPTSVRFKKDWGTAEEHLRLGLRCAKTLGSPVFRVVLGGGEDRKTPGGIRARIADTVEVLKKCRSQALELGVKVAVENHAGDLHSWELRDLIEAAGADFVGANFDSGNAAWTLEDPLDAFETLGKFTLCSSLRDDMIWESEDGATIQWTAAGEGLIDWRKLAARWAALCPNVAINIETISGFARNFPYKKPEFWEHYDKQPDRLAKFEALARRGRKIEPFKAPEGVEKKQAEQAYQRAQLESSIRYLRGEIGLGLKA